MALRLRWLTVALAGAGLVAVLLLVGALFPAVGHTFGKLNLPKGVADLLGGADYDTITGWYRSEIASIYGPLVISAVAITGAGGSTAGEEEDHVSALVLAHPVTRSRWVLAKGAAVGSTILVVAFACWIGLIAGVALGGGGIGVGHLAAYSVHLAFFGFAIGAIALALGAGTGRKALATGVSAAVAVAGWLINSFVPLVGAIDWLKYFSPFYYYADNDPLVNGIDLAHLLVLALLAAALTATAALTINRRDLHA
jgi:ABC-2 type transport system permease protein